MGELRSAWEIAQERASRLGRLSAEEKGEQERRRYSQIGQALAQKWLDGALKLDIASELHRLPAEEREMVKQAVIAHLIEAIDLAAAPDLDAVKRAIEGIGSLGRELRPVAEELDNLVLEYEEAERDIRHELESECRETLHRRRISGTAIADINLASHPQWQQARQCLIEAFTPRFADVKQTLIDTR
jgi:hypothetical protein